MKEELENLLSKALSALQTVQDELQLEEVRVQFLSRSGELPSLLKGLGKVSTEDRPAVGKLANEVKNKIQQAFDEKKIKLEGGVGEEDMDRTLPGKPIRSGSLHPVYQVRDRAIEIFRRLGFALAEGPDIEREYYNFDALNTPQDHPARNEKDTFYLSQGRDEKDKRYLLRTQTSPVQIRVMENQEPPFRIISPGRCYRRDEIDATHGLSFHQMEGLIVEKGTHFLHLKEMLEFFFRELLGENLLFRFRPHFFPFTEPSYEVDCARPGTEIKGKKWLEICGCGMVHPKVLESVGIDPEVYTGFAFGFGIERIAMQTYGIPDLRLFTENDASFLRQMHSTL